MTLAVVPEWVMWLYYLSTPLLVLVGLAGFAGVWMQWYAVHTTTNQERDRQALVAIRYFADAVCGHSNELFIARREAGVKPYEGPVAGFERETQAPEARAYLDEHLEELTQVKLMEPTSALTNALEYFAHPVVRGLASDAMVFRSCGDSFCAIMRSTSPLICAMRSIDDAEGYRNYSSAVELYGRWQPRIKSMKLEHEAGRLAGMASELRRRAVDLETAE